MADQLTTPETGLWTNPRVGGDRPSLVRLTPSALTLAAVPSADLDTLAESVRAGGDLAGQVVPLPTFLRAHADLDSKDLTIKYRAGTSGEDSKALTFVDRAQRDDFLAALVAALGPEWTRAERPTSRWTAGFWTLGPTALGALITGGLHAEATRIAAGQGPVNWGRGKLRFPAHVAHWLERHLGPTGILIAGGLLVAIGLGLFVLVMAWPPMLVLVERDPEVQGEPA